MAMWRWLACLLVVPAVLHGQSTGLQVQFSDRGLERLAYRGQVLEDLQRWPEDGFHIWHMKCFGLSGRVLPDGQHGWGENNLGRRWDRAQQTWTYRFTWGEIVVHYSVQADALKVQVTETNHGGSGVVFDGASVFPLALHLTEGHATTISDTMQAPGVTSIVTQAGRLALVAADAETPIYSGFEDGKDGVVDVLVSGTLPDALASKTQARGRMLKPGMTDHFEVSLRFAGADAPLEQVAQDAYRDWRMRWPMTLHWTDRRVIGTVFLASSAQGDRTVAAGFKSNPRRYFSDAHVDVQGGLAAFQARVLAQAEEVTANLKKLHAQGAITWDIEGEEYPQDTSYACAPDQIAELAPEMESVVGKGPYAGMKLDDAYFSTMRKAGMRVGVCVRPQHFTRDANGKARQVSLPDSEVAAELLRKMKYAHDRWGATLFYLDSTVRADGSTLPAAVIEQAAAAMPDSLLIPEETSTRLYRATAGYKTFLFHGDVSTEAAVRAVYPAAFSVNLINDVDGAKLAAQRKALVEAVRGGDVLMVHADHWQQNNDVVIKMLQEAKAAR